MKFLDVPQSGSFAGNTHSHNRAGQYRRNRRSPVQPVGTGRRALIRGNLTAASQGWNALTSAERASWAAFADSHPITDSLGQSIKLTGQQMFVRVGASLLNVGAALPADPPTDLDAGSLSGVSLTAAAGVPALSVAYTISPTTGYLNFAFSPQVSPGRSYNSRYWQGASIAASTVSPLDGLSAYNGEFGTLVAGQRIFVRVTPVSSEGWNGTPTIVSGLVAA